MESLAYFHQNQMMIQPTQNWDQIKAANEFYRKRENLLRSDIPTEDLLSQARPASDDYTLISNQPFKESEQGRYFRVVGKADNNQYVLKEFMHNFANKDTEQINKEQIYREIDNMRKLDHPLVVQMFDIV